VTSVTPEGLGIDLQEAQNWGLYEWLLVSDHRNPQCFDWMMGNQRFRRVSRAGDQMEWPHRLQETESCASW
jgi:hypothetical protein